MYPKNAASPEPIAIGAVIQISDGAVQTSGVTVRIKPIGVAEADGANAAAYSTDGIVLYTPTQAETNYTSFVLIAKKTGCIPVALTIVTTSSATPGTVLLAPVTHTSAVVPTVTTLTGHTAQTGDSFARIGATGSGLTSLASQTSVNAIGSASAITVERSISDTNSITFAWPVSGATITGTRSINNGTYGAVTGAIAFLRTETGKHYYTLAYNAADRPSAEGQVRYKFVDGTYTRYVVLRVATAVLDSADKDTLVDLVWDEVLTGATHNIARSSGKRLRQTTAFQQIDATVNDAAASTTTFITTLDSSVDNFYNDSMLVFTDGALTGQVRAIYDYIGATKTIVLEEALTSAPVNGVAFAIVSLHIHPVSQIQSGLATAAALATESTKITAIETFATRVTTGLVADGAVYQFTANMLELGPSGGGGGDATLAKQTEILAAIQGSAVIQVASPNVSGNLVLTQGDDYDGVANPKASWTVTTDYTSGWTVRLTIRSSTDTVIYTNTGSVVSATVVAVTIAAPTGLTMTGCPGQWQGKFDVELTHSSGKKKTIALGVCYINEDQTR